MTFPRALIFLPALAVACGGATPAPKPAPPPAPVPSVEPPVEADVDPRAEPKDVLAVVNVSQAHLIDAALRTGLDFHVPVPYPSPEIEALASKDAPLQSLILLDTGGARLTPGVRDVSSAGLTSYDDAERLLRELADAGQGTLERRGSRGLLFRGDYGMPCLLLATTGATPARLICGEEPGLSRVAPFMAHTLPAQADSAPVAWVRMPVKALYDRHGMLVERARVLLPSMASAQLKHEPTLHRWLSPALSPLLEESVDLFSDLETVTARAELNGADLVLEVNAKLRAKKSWTARALTDAAPNAGVPTIFWQLPDQAELAFFSARVPEARAAEMQSFFVQWLRGALGRGTSGESIELIAATFSPDAAFAYAHGDVLGRDADRKTSGGERLREQMLSVYGWHLMAYDEPAASYEPKLVRGMDAYNKGDLRRIVYRELPRLCDGLGPITRRPTAPGLPKGSAIFELKVPGKLLDDCWSRRRAPATVKAKDSALVVVMVPDGARTFIGLSPDEADIKTKLLAAVTGAKGTLGGPGAAPGLVEAGALAGGFITLRGAAGLQRFVRQWESSDSRRSRYDDMPFQGRTRIPFSIGTPSATDATRLELRARIPAQALRDLAGQGAARELRDILD